MHPHSTGKYLIWLALLLATCVVLFVISLALKGSPVPQSVTGTQKVSAPPPFTEEIAAQLAASKGFAALVSYTDNGFEPKTATIQAGETIRFTNNSSGDMWVASSAQAGAIYPGQGVCGQSVFDVCKAISRGMFYEFTFNERGTWGYHDNTEPIKTGAIIVQ